MAFSTRHDPASLIIGNDWLAPLSKGLLDITQRRGDYSIGDDADGNLPLWFWWGPQEISTAHSQ